MQPVVRSSEQSDQKPFLYTAMTWFHALSDIRKGWVKGVITVHHAL